MVDVTFWQPKASALPIWEGTPPGFDTAYQQPVPTLTPYLVSGSGTSGAVVVLPGGGYGMKAAHEAEPVALWLNSLGIAAFVLDYRVAPYRHPIPLMDAQRAIQVVRSQAQAWGVSPDRVGILGFSAGGHLASSAATHLHPASDRADAVSAFSCRPDAAILCYPVITFGKHRHNGSMENLLGLNPAQELRESLSNETQVSAETPPAFLWHTADDQAVPVENSLLFAQALSECNVPYELHIFAHGEHGVGLAYEHPYAQPWTSLCGRWLGSLGFTRAAAGQHDQQEE